MIFSIRKRASTDFHVKYMAYVSVGCSASLEVLQLGGRCLACCEYDQVSIDSPLKYDPADMCYRSSSQAWLQQESESSFTVMQSLYFTIWKSEW